MTEEITVTFPVVTRRHDWAERLTEFLHNCMVEKVCLDWDPHNCASWVADSCLAMADVDFYKDFREHPTPRGLLKVLAQKGCKTHVDAARLLFPEIPLMQAHRGDWIVVAGRPGCGPEAHCLDSEDFTALALCIADPPFAWTLTETGIERIPLLECLYGLKVGDV